MKELEITGANRFENCTRHRTACRGIVLRDDKILLSYESAVDQYGIPGGGTEVSETPVDCCRREIAEETGIVVSAGERFLTIKEYYEEWCFETYYFICTPIGKTEANLTPAELQRGLTPRWLNIDEALDIFSRHQNYAATNEEKRGIYLREYMALREYINAQL